MNAADDDRKRERDLRFEENQSQWHTNVFQFLKMFDINSLKNCCGKILNNHFTRK